MLKRPEIRLGLRDTEWPFTYTDHDRQIVRAIIYDADGYFYFVRAHRNDEFGNATLIETSGGGVEPGEDLQQAIIRELGEELGAEVELVCSIGVVSDYYNLIHRHNINHYFLCRAKRFGQKHLTQDEIEDFHLSTLKLRYEEAVREYEHRACTPLGRLLANRELPVLRRAHAILRELGEHAVFAAEPGSAELSLEKLLHGNELYKSGAQNPAYLDERIRMKTAEEGQTPFAAVVCCADSRVPVEHVFSVGVGELFVIRNAGNVMSRSALASVEYAVAHLHVPMVLVLGHRGCGAVAAALSGHEEPGALGELVAQVRANIGTAKTAEEAELANLQSSVAALQESACIRQAIEAGKLTVAGAIYDIASGEVSFEIG